MAPIQTFTETPINASTVDGITPKTKSPEDNQVPYAPTTTAPSSSYTPAQPGAAPSLPAVTAAAQTLTGYQPTPTQSIPLPGPPPPQPGAFPVPPSSNSSTAIPPPPKSGEVLPPQMSYAAPTQSFPAKAGSSTVSAPPHAEIPGATPTLLQNIGSQSANFSHPPGYHQDTQAAEFSSSQRAAHNASVSWGQQEGEAGDEEGIWNTAKKWAASAGESLVAAENEVWKRINKD